MKKIQSLYKINILGLENKSYDYSFEGDSSFFELFEEEDPLEGTFKAEVKLEKSTNMLQLHFEISAIMELICDRSLELFKEVFEIKEKYIFKFGDRSEEVSESMEVIPFGAVDINVSQLLYDFIALAVPIKKVHPSLRASDSGEDEFIVFERKEENKKPKLDARWAALEGLKDKLKE